MPIYEYINDETGEIANVQMGMREEHPETMLIDGKEYRRVFSAWQVDAGVARKVHKYPYISNANSPHCKGAKLVPDPKTGRMKPLITSQRHEREFAARNDLTKD